ncbi:sugar phosphate isomerase/epimerase [Mesobacillus foraminis]|uniref:sugar phosphate isomerase/epimerase family protein n=1 Tax=Mesobacillus foraminis TaxID=279826 RepID=UPI001BE72C9D|nr:sugar phosphate isomerase/epimerase family protein [Mesobacillus foraminis]MBT2757838.1 sugar phosphate isomerase/epimerase [Mesobacillus foraminis]
MSRPINTIGIMSYVYLEHSAEEMAADIASRNISIVQADPRQKGLLDANGKYHSKRAKEVRKIFADQRISIPVLSGYMNLLDPILERREHNLTTMEEMIKLCPEFGAPYIATETGSFHPENQWRYHPENDTEKAWDALLAIIERLRKTAVDNGVTLLLEGYVTNVLNTPEKAERLINELGSEGLGFVMDPFNLMKLEDLDQQEAALDKIFSAIIPFSPIAHAKDAIYTEKGLSTPCAGTGKAKWDQYALRLSKQAPAIPLFLEHLKPEEIENCIKYIQKSYDFVSI